MRCERCKHQKWCVCLEMLKLHKTTISKHNQCICCTERARVIDTFQIETSSETRQKMKRLSINLLYVYRILFEETNR